MKIRTIIFLAVVGVAAIAIVGAVIETGQSVQENKIRVAFFPNVGHVVPIVGYETGIFSEGLGNQTLIETKCLIVAPKL